MDIEYFVFEQTAQWARRNVADRVVARLARSEPRIGQGEEQIRNILQRHEVILHILPRGEMAFSAGETVGRQRQLIHLIGSSNTARDFRADHVNAGLALRIDATPQALRAELVVGDLARYPLLRVGTKKLDVGADGLVVFNLDFLLRQYCFRGGHRNTLISIEITIFGS